MERKLFIFTQSLLVHAVVSHKMACEKVATRRSIPLLGRRGSVSWLFLLLLLATVITPAEGKGRRRKQQQTYNVKKRECETTECGGASEDDRPNCVLKCQSDTCYDSVYAADELEPGEIDNHRQRLFTRCLNEEAKQKMHQRHAQRAAVNAPATTEPEEPEEPEGLEDLDEDESFAATANENQKPPQGFVDPAVEL